MRIVLRYHSAYGFSRSIRLGPALTIICWMSGTRGAHPGTEYGPQWMKTPSLASSYQSGSRCVRTESHVPSYTTAAPSRHRVLASPPSCGDRRDILSRRAISMSRRAQRRHGGTAGTASTHKTCTTSAITQRRSNSDDPRTADRPPLPSLVPAGPLRSAPGERRPGAARALARVARLPVAHPEGEIRERPHEDGQPIGDEP